MSLRLRQVEGFRNLRRLFWGTGEYRVADLRPERSTTGEDRGGCRMNSVNMQCESDCAHGALRLTWSCY